MSTTAIVPMRHESERVPGKNYRELAGRPLYAHILDTLRECPELDEVVVDTDSPVIRAGVEEGYPAVRIIDRPHELRGGHVSMNDVLRHDLTLVTADVILQTHATNPFLRAATVSAALRAFGAARGDRDSLFSVTAVQKRFWTSDARPVNHDPEQLLRTQDLPPLYEENSCLYVFPRETLQRFGRRIGNAPLLYAIDPLEAWDIDDDRDWAIAEHLATSVVAS
jgi:CMP-N-acetylneuraminic acid synthetase